MQLSPLVEYLLAYRDTGGIPIAKMTTRITTVPAFPPLTSVVFQTLPLINTYALIEFHWRMSPSVTPDAFTIDINVDGFQLFGSVLGALAMSDGWGMWIEITSQHPTTVILTNNTPLWQYLEIVDFWIVIPTQENYNKMLEIIRNWGR